MPHFPVIRLVIASTNITFALCQLGADLRMSDPWLWSKLLKKVCGRERNKPESLNPSIVHAIRNGLEYFWPARQLAHLSQFPRPSQYHVLLRSNWDPKPSIRLSFSEYSEPLNSPPVPSGHEKLWYSVLKCDNLFPASSHRLMPHIPRIARLPQILPTDRPPHLVDAEGGSNRIGTRVLCALPSLLLTEVSAISQDERHGPQPVHQCVSVIGSLETGGKSVDGSPESTESSRLPSIRRSSLSRSSLSGDTKIPT
ncbi:hypothetical protein SISNIDRAFT_489039 [Sistotremastrum niveocremeum HHB9708]|uniref:Uncharacterized protein n=1 Tax=Sistotremastrum niveocremeum HHB9708 TaxID=1314777 RepID=A0A164QFI4_9AGAM|nr:hypothetical protein SISNIDRAFT_489039 [Sistotremastrum niveocremeum HHB9708]